MHDKVTNIIALAKHRDVIDRTELICRYIRMKYHLRLSKEELNYRVAFLKDTLIYDSL
jgi:hypothetical protein